MARLSEENTQIVSLFPMFNILICTLGVLIFILSTVVTLSLGPGKTVTINVETPSGSNITKTPHYLEWDGTNLIIHPSKEKVTFDVNLRSIETFREAYEYITNAIAGTPLQNLFQDVRQNRRTKYLIVLVRPSGFKNFIAIRGYIEKLDIDIGYEPVNQGWNLRVKG